MALFFNLDPRLAKGDVAEQVQQLKQQPGKDLALFGSADLAASFIRLGLIDEYRILVTPVVLGAGTPMFKNLEGRLGLDLVSATTWSSGTVALHYQPQGQYLGRASSHARAQRQPAASGVS